MSKLHKQLEKIDALIANIKGVEQSLHDLKASLTHEADLTTKANMPNHTLAISRDDLIVLKRMYDAAMASGKERFEFKGQVLLTQYAKYVIEYTESGFDSTRR